jgi:hypothetical protein
MKELLDKLRECGWLIEESNVLEMPIAIQSRYKTIPNVLLNFFCSFSLCVNPNEKQWLLSSHDYNENSNFVYKWNEFELLSLDAAGNDEEWKQEIINFWNRHLPIFQSVEGEYFYLAIEITSTGSGEIVIGHEPDFEEVDTFARNIHQFPTRFLEFVKCT